MPKRRFHICDILRIITGREFFVERGYITLDILSFMSGCKIFSWEIQEAIINCRPHLLRQFPQLSTPEIKLAIAELEEMLKTPTGKMSPRALTVGWISRLISGQYGIQCDEILEVAPI